MDWEEAAAHTSHRQWTKQSSTAVLEDMNSWTLDPETSLKTRRRSVSLKWLWHIGCTVRQWHTQYLCLPPCVSSCSLLLYIYPSLLFYLSLIAHWSLYVLPSIHLLFSLSISNYPSANWPLQTTHKQVHLPIWELCCSGRAFVLKIEYLQTKNHWTRKNTYIRHSMQMQKISHTDIKA